MERRKKFKFEFVIYYQTEVFNTRAHNRVDWFRVCVAAFYIYIVDHDQFIIRTSYT